MSNKSSIVLKRIKGNDPIIKIVLVFIQERISAGQ
jgi:hypothetical protein